MYIGVVGAVLGLGKLHAVRHEYDFTGSSRFAWSIMYIGLLCVAAYGVGLPDLVRGRRPAVYGALGAGFAGALGISTLQLLGGSALLPRFVVFGAAVVLVPWLAMCAGLASGGRARAEERDRVVVVAASDEVQTLRDDLRLAPERNAQIVSALSPAEASTSEAHQKPLIDAVLGKRATVVVLARSAQLDESIVGQAATLHESGMRVRTLSLFYEDWLGKLAVSELERISLMFDVGELHRARYGRVKRLIDVLLATAGLPFLVVVVPIVFVGDVVANGGPLFYRQQRVGRGGRHFEILKFRTMRPATEGEPTVWTGQRDPRITPWGRLLRETHVDELPQIVNILRGDLSVVGPRPEQPHYVDELSAKIPFYDLRHLVRPGLTGWAQVKYGYAGDEKDALEKLQYEFFYLRHQSLTFDLRIMGRTIRSVVGLAGR
jgi:lipopolysaccharide/colanic/teichoic acid biosynthesis glycosyltransferase